MKKEGILICTVNFGLGPVGKVASIVYNLKDKFDFYACGNKFDLSIFKDDMFKDYLFSRKKEELKKFIDKYNIKYAISVLDGELLNTLQELNVKVLFVDSLPFMWTQADVDEGLIPINADFYCAQKCINVTEDSKKVLSQIKNLKWINPIQIKSDIEYTPFDTDYAVINVGGLHSPIGNGESYIKTILIPTIDVLLNENLHVIVTCGAKAKETIIEVFDEYNLKYKNLKIETLEHNKFISSIKNSKLFITSPGLTTIYETSYLLKPTILLPPQNLSQFYNIEYAKKIFNEYKVLNWETSKLNLDYLKEILPKGETYVVDKVYEYITELVDSDYTKKFKSRFSEIIKQKYNKKLASDFVVEGNGSDDIKEILLQLIKEDNNEV